MRTYQGGGKGWERMHASICGGCTHRWHMAVLSGGTARKAPHAGVDKTEGNGLARALPFPCILRCVVCPPVVGSAVARRNAVVLVQLVAILHVYDHLLRGVVAVAVREPVLQ